MPGSAWLNAVVQRILLNASLIIDNLVVKILYEDVEITLTLAALHIATLDPANGMTARLCKELHMDRVAGT